MRGERGVTLLELLVSVLILGLLITVVLAPLTQLFGRTAQSAQTLQATTQAQGAVEQVRGQWQSYPVVPNSSATPPVADVNAARRAQSQARYDRTCFSLPAASGVTVAVTVRALNRSGSETGSLTVSTCPTPLTAPTSFTLAPMKRVTVTVSTAGGEARRLTVDIPRP